MDAYNRSDAFHYGAQIKGKPNSQGTLFRVNPDQRTPESRQPRGYSPERYAEVGKATHLVSEFDQKYYGRTQVVGGPRNAPHNAQMLATLARSTAPASDMKGSGYRTDDISEGTFLGQYTNPSVRGAAKGYESQIVVRPTAVQGRTPIHELGHHVDYNRDPSAFRRGEPGARGEQEGFADKYAAEHARQPGYKRKHAHEDYQDAPSRPHDWDTSYGNVGQDATDFGVHYNQARYRDDFHPSLSGDQFSLESRRKSGELPKEHIDGQEPMLDKFAHIEKDDSRVGHHEAHHWSYSYDPS